MTTVLVPPLNFALVAPGIYRSGYPNKKNFKFLVKLELKSVLYLCEDDLSQENLDFFRDQDIQLFHVRMEGSKEPFVELDHSLMTRALTHVLDTRNHPILVHCNKGKHRIGCLVACLRKLENWALTAMLDEYQRFSGSFGSKIRMEDQEVGFLLLNFQFIQMYNHSVIKLSKKYAPGWVHSNYLTEQEWEEDS